MGKREIEKLKRRRKTLEKRMRALGPLMRGSVVELAMKCGNRNCRCARGEKHKKTHFSISMKGKTKMMYLELQMHGEDRKKRIEELGIRAGDPIILNRPIKRGFSEDSFYGAYLDNGLGCFVVAEIAKLLAKSPLENIRVFYTIEKPGTTWHKAPEPHLG